MPANFGVAAFLILALLAPGVVSAQDAAAFRKPVMEAIGTVFRESSPEQLRELGMSPSAGLSPGLSDEEVVKAVSPDLSESIAALSTPEELAAMTDRLSGWALGPALSDKQRSSLIKVAVQMHREVPPELSGKLRLNAKTREMIQELLRIEFQERGIPLETAKLVGRTSDFTGDNALRVIVKTEDPDLKRKIPQHLGGLIPVYRKPPPLASLRPFRPEPVVSRQVDVPKSQTASLKAVEAGGQAPPILVADGSSEVPVLQVTDPRLLATADDVAKSGGRAQLAISLFDENSKRVRRAGPVAKDHAFFEERMKAFAQHLQQKALETRDEAVQRRILDVLASNLDGLRLEAQYFTEWSANAQVSLIEAIGKIAAENSSVEIQNVALFKLAWMPKWTREAGDAARRKRITAAGLAAMTTIAESSRFKPELVFLVAHYLHESLRGSFSEYGWKRFRMLAYYRRCWAIRGVISAAHSKIELSGIIPGVKSFPEALK